MGEDGATPPRAIVVAGVSGSGKTTVGRLLAQRLGWSYVEADDHHPPENKAKMARGEPLDDDDRRPWLASLRRELDRHVDAGRGVVLSSSALKASYRRVLTEGRPEAAIVLLHGSRELVARRLGERSGHFFDPALLDTQYATLELPERNEKVPVFAVDQPPERIAEGVVRELGLTRDGGDAAAHRPPDATDA